MLIRKHIKNKRTFTDSIKTATLITQTSPTNIRVS